MKAFETTFDNVLYRFFLMMAIVIGSFVFNVPFLAILAVPVFLSALLGVKFEFVRKETVSAKVKPMPNNTIAA